MQAAPVPESSVGEPYWQRRAVETESKLLLVENDDLRVVYVELIGHYRRMASLVGKATAGGSALQCRREPPAEVHPQGSTGRTKYYDDRCAAPD